MSTAMYFFEWNNMWNSYKLIKLGRVESESGMLPLRLFWLRDLLNNHHIYTSHWKFIIKLRVKNKREVAPYKNWSFLRFPREAGISPVRRLFSRSKLLKLVKLPNSSGIFPVMPFPCKVLPCHKHKNVMHEKWFHRTLRLLYTLWSDASKLGEEHKGKLCENYFVTRMTYGHNER